LGEDAAGGFNGETVELGRNFSDTPARLEGLVDLASFFKLAAGSSGKRLFSWSSRASCQQRCGIPVTSMTDTIGCMINGFFGEFRGLGDH